MTAYDSSEGAGPGHGRLDNGLRAPAYVPLTDVEAAVGEHLLDVLGRARIAAYLGPADPVGDQAGATRQRLFVASEERGDARTIVRATVRALGSPDGVADGPTADADGAAQPAIGAGAGAAGDVAGDAAAGDVATDSEPADPLAGKDTDAIFRELIADWHVDTHVAIREAERQLRREDADWRARLARGPVEDPEWLDEDHFVPPPPPPLPRLAGMTVLGVFLILLAIALLAFGSRFLPGNLGLVLGICSVLTGGVVLFTRLRDTYSDEDDDGAAV